MSAYAKLQEARIRLQGMKLKKSGKNKFAGYDYFELGDFLPAINQIFHELKLCAVVSFGDKAASLTIVDVELEPSLAIAAVQVTCPMAEAGLKGMTPVQNLGATMTYIRRYLYVTALEIVEHDALDAVEPEKKSPGVIKPTDGARDGLYKSQIEMVDRLVGTVVDCFEAAVPETAYQAIEEAKLDADEKTYLWSQLDSKQRSALKKIGEAKKLSPLHA